MTKVNYICKKIKNTQDLRGKPKSGKTTGRGEEKSTNLKQEYKIERLRHNEQVSLNIALKKFVSLTPTHTHTHIYIYVHMMKQETTKDLQGKKAPNTKQETTKDLQGKKAPNTKQETTKNL